MKTTKINYPLFIIGCGFIILGIINSLFDPLKFDSLSAYFYVGLLNIIVSYKDKFKFKNILQIFISILIIISFFS